jgi:hypothetical protein
MDNLNIHTHTPWFWTWYIFGDTASCFELRTGRAMERLNTYSIHFKLGFRSTKLVWRTNTAW